MRGRVPFLGVVRLALIVTVVLGGWDGPSRAQGLNAEFDARDLSRRDKRTLQGTLSLVGDYAGFLDGRWGRESQAALERFTARRFDNDKPKNRHLRPLLTRLRREVEAGGWLPLDLDQLGVSLWAPTLLLHENDSEPHPTYQTVSRDLLLRFLFNDFAATKEMHDWMAASHRGSEPFYTTRANNYWISAATLGSGKDAYLRSLPFGGALVSILIQSEPAQKGRAALMAASIRRGPPVKISLGPASRLAALMREAPENDDSIASAESAPAADASEASEAGEASGSSGSRGTGFFVNATDLVTAAHVVDDCSNITTGEGAHLTPVAEDAGLDVAVLAMDGRSAHWLNVSTEADPGLGESIVALGYPYAALLGGNLTVTGGNVSALGGFLGDRDYVTVSAPVQPGSSGGPVLDETGRVVGVVVAGLSEAAILEATGTLPQNVNFALARHPLAEFFDAAKIMLADGVVPDVDVEDGLPKKVRSAVVPVVCH